MSVFVTRKIRNEGIDLLKKAFKHVEVWEGDCACPRDLLLKKASTCFGLLTQLNDNIDEKVLKNKNLKIVSQNAVGYDNIDVASATKHGVLIANTPGVLTDACADQAWALMLAAARHLTESERYTRAGCWKGSNPLLSIFPSPFASNASYCNPPNRAALLK